MSLGIPQGDSPRSFTEGLGEHPSKVSGGITPVTLFQWFELYKMSSVEANPGWILRARRAQESEGSDTGLRPNWSPPSNKLNPMDKFTITALVGALESIKTDGMTPIGKLQAQYEEGVITDIEYVFKAGDAFTEAMSNVSTTLTGY